MPDRSVTAQELAADPKLRDDFFRAVNAPVATVPVPRDSNGEPLPPFRRSTWDEPSDYFASDHGWPKSPIQIQRSEAQELLDRYRRHSNAILQVGPESERELMGEADNQI